MAKKKSTDEAQLSEGEVVASESNKETVSPEPVQATEQVAEESSAPVRLTKSSTEDDARKYVKQNYEVPEWCRVVYVTSDSNVFWQNHESEAVSHATNNQLKLFRLAWH